MIVVASLFSKSFVVKMFSVHSKTQSRRIIRNSSDLKSVFEKGPFSWRVSVDDKAGEPNRKNRAAGFSNFSGVVWTEAKVLLSWSFNFPFSF